ncbi:DUF1801 domain-containing protein [Euzebya tangerina]|uniref:DUF1801 domain-containing protein n=1 Tax=Euzebya tangerina TaxID=591198 RepID=UPI000E31A34A|nr:DUF1801 domain-containing protein [Euzebya tangerina]
MEISETTPDAYLESLDGEAGEVMRAVDDTIVAAMPERVRVLWEGTFWGGSEQTIIGYGDIVQSRPKGPDVEWFLVGLARQKATYSLYVNAAADGTYLGHAYAERLGAVKLGAANVSFKRLEDLDLDGLTAMLQEADRITPPDRR